MAEDRYGLYVLVIVAVAAIASMVIVAHPFSFNTVNSAGMAVAGSTDQHIITQGEGDYYVHMDWYNGASQAVMHLVNNNVTVGTFYGYYPPMPSDIFLGHFVSGSELTFTHTTGWRGGVYGPFYSNSAGSTSDPGHYWVSYNGDNTWTIKFNDGTGFSPGQVHGQFEVYEKVASNNSGPVCGNGLLEGSEICDPGYVPTAIKNCTAFMPTWIGTAACKSTCDGYNTDTCAKPTNNTNPVAVCTDSDGGLNYYIQGTATGNYIGSAGPVICGLNGDPACYSRTDGVSYSTYYDVCVSGSNQLDEGYCLPDGTLGGKGYTCPNGCSNGACIVSTNVTNSTTCYDSDSGINYYTKGYATGVQVGNPSIGVVTLYDYCAEQDSSITERYCGSDGLMYYSHYTCPNGCGDGVCAPSPTNVTNSTACYDSDGGINYYVQGYVTYAGYVSNGELVKEYDECAVDDYGNSIIQEKYCTNVNGSGGIGLIDHQCPSGCINGACTADTTNITSDMTLKNFPQPFLNKGGQPDTIFVVGRRAAVDDVIGITDIVASLQRYAGNNPFPTGIVKFDDEITGNDYNRNMIVVGGPCANSAAEDIYGMPMNCTAEDTPGVGVIELIPNKKALMVHGYNAEDTTMATRVLANWNDYNKIFKDATKVCVTGSLNNINAYKC